MTERLPTPDTIVRGDIRWGYGSLIVAMHVLALLALVPWFFSWTGVIVMVLGVHVFGQAINLCYHRVLTHKACKLPRWLEHAMVYMALCCLEESPARWVAIHRHHHKHSDHQPDPHSPLVHFVWAHVGWMMIHNTCLDDPRLYASNALDILRDRFYMRLEKKPRIKRNVYLIHALLFAVVGALIGFAMQGTAIGALQMAGSFVVWGVIVRTIAVWHITWSVNSLTHLFGYANHASDDHSRNNWLVAIFTVGEGWHNNHHADPRSASNQHRWWELDVTYYQIVLLEKLGLATDVIRPKHIRRRAARRAAA